MGEKELLLTYGCQKSKLKISFAFQFSLNGRGVYSNPSISRNRHACTRFPHDLHTRARFPRIFHALTRSQKSASTRTHARVFHACATSAHAHARDFHARARFPLFFHARVHARTRARTRARMSQIVFRRNTICSMRARVRERVRA